MQEASFGKACNTKNYMSLKIVFRPFACNQKMQINKLQLYKII